MTVADSQPRACPLGWGGDVLVLLAIAGWLVGVHLAHPGLVDPDEPRSAMVARLMVEQGDWLAPHLPVVFHHDYPHDPVEGDLFAYWDKPPLIFWMSAAAMKVLGPTALAARLPAALGHVAAVLLVYMAGRFLWGRAAGLMAGLIMATAPLPLVMAHVARMDALLVALMTAMLLATLRLMYGTNRPWVWTLVLYITAGLGLLTKGLEAVAFPAAAILITVVLTGRWRDLVRLRPVAGAIITLAIAMPWYAYMHWRYPPAGAENMGFLYEFLVRQHFGRATTGEFGHVHHPPGYLLGILLLGFLPWTIFLPGACVRLGREGWRLRREQPAAVFLLIWAVLIVAVFSLSRTQLVHYVDPAFPAIALLTGAYVVRQTSAEKPSRWFVAGLIVTTALGIPAVGALVVYLRLSDIWHSHYWWIAGALAAITVAGTVSVARGRHAAAVALLVAGIVFAMTFIFAADPFRIYRENTARADFLAMEKVLRPGDAVLAFPYTPYSFAWCAWPREVPYPTAAGSEEPNLNVLIAQLNQPRRTFVILQKRGTLEALRGKLRWPIQVITESKNHTLILTAPPETEPTREP